MVLPEEVKIIIKKLQDSDFEGYAVGGCVRDLLLGKEPKDWDITTNAKPEEIQKLFPEHVYENTFGTVAIKTGSEKPELALIEVTPYRIEGKYTDKRHPDSIKFADKLEDDLSRRDFTVNAIVISIDGKITDLFNGQKNLKSKVIRTVGEPEERFGEDALRLLRAVRFATVLGFKIEKKTLEAIVKNADWLIAISKERIRDEFVKIINSDNAYGGIMLLYETGLLKHIVPELLEGVDISQNLHHIYTVWEHNTLALKYAANKNYSLEVRLGSLFHDIGKPQTKRGDGKYSTFYGHDVIGAKITAGIMERLRFSKETAESVVKLVRYHLFYYNVGEVTESSVRRLLANVGPENIDDLIKVREADRIGSGRPKAVPYKLRHLQYIIDKVSHDPISVKMLKVDGEDVMKELYTQPGPKIGLILNYLLAEVIDNPAKNTKEYLEKRIHELDKKSPEELKKSLEKIEKAIEEEEKERMKKYYV
ncbi:MAG: PolyA polymerase family protein [Candidatus Yanofskybacteria bacterium GW2011_GWA1_41_6]|uniref:PolyA polymerase family protein n=1 Tax=Candidatus Yanofskybacteria bacterium GW2011_GWA1_41_6 TaxID=1619020 RepID=A0A0G0YTG4_9BACT|nr:MAG: PolyA polymerase family protein [Candidatus Yanofskybacteria bacterium GW2011_GWA1_41_6]